MEERAKKFKYSWSLRSFAAQNMFGHSAFVVAPIKYEDCDFFLAIDLARLEAVSITAIMIQGRI